MSVESARTALVDELNDDFEFVKEASLSEDGYTIAVIFEDDTAALLFTYQEPAAENSEKDDDSIISYGYNLPIEKKEGVLKVSSKPYTIIPVASDLSSSDSCEEVSYNVPQSKKVR